MDKVHRIKYRGDKCVVRVSVSTIEVVRIDIKLLELSNETARVYYTKF